MRRITTWLTATLAVVAMITYYQVSLSGDGKAESGRTGAAECGAARQPAASTSTVASTAAVATTTTPATTTTAAGRSTDSAAPGSDDRADDPCATSDHTGKPGESR